MKSGFPCLSVLRTFVPGLLFGPPFGHPLDFVLLDEPLSLTPCVPMDFDFVMKVTKHQKQIDRITLQQCKHSTTSGLDDTPGSMVSGVITQSQGLVKKLASGVAKGIGLTSGSSPRSTASNAQSHVVGS